MALTKTPIELSSTPSIVDGGNATAITIDSSERVLVGKTSAGDYVTGIEMQPAGAILSYRTSGVASIFGRTDDGEITRFTRGTSGIGTVGVENSDNFYIGASAAGHGGLYFGNNNMSPMAAGVRADATMDVGAASYRFKNLYLSGGAYLGGTAAANKLDDYEEGVWTPVPVGLGDSGGTYSGFYTKTGRIVNWSCYIVLPSTSDTSFGIFGGFPFVSTGGQGTTGNSGVSYKNSATDLQILINQSTATMFWYNSAGSQQTYANFSGKSLYMGGSYITDL